jgi:hypothetical protein
MPHGEYEWDDWAKETWPPRSKKDMQIRRGRFGDWIDILSSDDKREFITSMSATADYIFVSNLLLARIIFGQEWFFRLKRLGAFAQGVDHFITVAKTVSDMIKTRGLIDTHWTNYVEMACLGGYRNPPFKDFDIKKETLDLANSGLTPHDYLGFTFEEAVKKHLPMAFRPVRTKLTFLEFIASGSWVTAGASQMARFSVVIEGKLHKFKGKKNTLLDRYTPEVLHRMCMAWKKQVNYTITKAELGKIRPAVSADDLGFLIESFFDYCLNGCYLDWPGVTSSESFVTQTNRMYAMLELCKTMRGLPFDYRRFDHQPTMAEDLAIVSHVLATGRMNASDVDEYDTLVANNIESYSHAVLIARPIDTGDDEEYVCKVKGGVQSGRRFTSLMGNAWNAVMTGIVLDALSRLGLPVEEIIRWIKGDDSAIFTPNWGEAALVKMTYDAIGVEAGDGKFSIQEHAMEFLRIWYDRQCRGYPCRALPGLMQRKPWTSGPWTPDMSLKTVWDVLATLRRRCPDSEPALDILWNHYAPAWCRRYRIPVEALTIPVNLGGLGIQPPTVLARLEPSLAHFDQPLSLYANISDHRAKKLQLHFKERYDISIPDKRADELAQQEFTNVIVADDIPAIAGAARLRWIDLIKATHFKVIPLPYAETPIIPPDLNAWPIPVIDLLEKHLDDAAPLFGSHPELQVALTDHKRSDGSLSLMEWLKLYYSSAYMDMRLFHRSWHRGEIIDYLEGRLPVGCTRLHPQLTHIRDKLVAASVNPRANIKRLSMALQAPIMEEHVYRSRLSSLLYRW